MEQFIKIPYLPTQKVTSVLVDYRINKESENTLNELGIKVLKTKPHPNLYEAVLGHPDMQIALIGENRAVSCPENARYYKELLPDFDVIIGKTQLKSSYPEDISYNVLRVGECLFHNLKYTDSTILESSENLIQFNVKQGYSKCSACVISDKAVITSDVGIKNQCKKAGIEALLVDDSNVSLNGVSHGFFGGSTGLIAPDKLTVNGDIKTHKNGKEICDFCSKFGVKIIPLKSGIIEDIGTIIPLKQLP